MEDNEFEEVTIISHTDHGTSVLPQSTAERLMKEIKLEVTQKISQNENQKLGSLSKFGATSARLNTIQQKVMKESPASHNLFFISAHPHVGHQKKIILGIQAKALIVNCSPGEDITSRPKDPDQNLMQNLGVIQPAYNHLFRPIPIDPPNPAHQILGRIMPETPLNRVLELPAQSDGLIQYILFWGPFIFCFRYHNPVEIYELDGRLLKVAENKSAGDASTTVYTTLNRVYFRNQDMKIASFDRELEEDVLHAVGKVADFCVSSSTDELTTLSRFGIVERGDLQTKILGDNLNRSNFKVIKQFYNGDFLVAETVDNANTVFYLLTWQDLRKSITSEMLPYPCFSLRVLRPRKGIEMFFALCFSYVHFIARYGRKFLFLATFITKGINTYSMCSIEKNNWIFVGSRNTAFGMKLTFPRQLNFS